MGKKLTQHDWPKLAKEIKKKNPVQISVYLSGGPSRKTKYSYFNKEIITYKAAAQKRIKKDFGKIVTFTDRAKKENDLIVNSDDAPSPSNSSLKRGQNYMTFNSFIHFLKFFKGCSNVQKKMKKSEQQEEEQENPELEEGEQEEETEEQEIDTQQENEEDEQREEEEEEEEQEEQEEKPKRKRREPRGRGLKVNQEAEQETIFQRNQFLSTLQISQQVDAWMRSLKKTDIPSPYFLYVLREGGSKKLTPQEKKSVFSSIQTPSEVYTRVQVGFFDNLFWQDTKESVFQKLSKSKKLETVLSYYKKKHESRKQEDKQIFGKNFSETQVMPKHLRKII